MHASFIAFQHNNTSNDNPYDIDHNGNNHQKKEW